MKRKVYLYAPLLAAWCVMVTASCNDSKPPIYRVVFVTGPEASEAPLAQNVERGKKATQPPNPTRTGYVFTGWHLDEQRATPQFTFEDPIIKGITLYARWESVSSPTTPDTPDGGNAIPDNPETKSYTVSFDLQKGSSNNAADQTVKLNEKASKPSPNPVRTGYRFTGWYEKETGGEAFKFDTPITADLKLYARWEQYLRTLLGKGVGNNEATLPDNPTKNLSSIAVGSDDVLYFYSEGAIRTLNLTADKLSPSQLTTTAFNRVAGMTIGGDGNLYIADEGGLAIYKVDLSASPVKVSKLAGGSSPQTQGKVDNGIGDKATFFDPSGIVADDKYLYVTEKTQSNSYSAIRKIDIATSEVTSVPIYKSDPLIFVVGIALDGQGSAYVTEALSHRIRKVILATGVVSEVAGAKGMKGDKDGPIKDALFNTPTGLAVGKDGALYVADTGNNKVRKIATDGTVSTLLSNDDLGAGPYLTTVAGVALSVDGSVVYVSDTWSMRILDVPTN